MYLLQSSLHRELGFFCMVCEVKANDAVDQPISLDLGRKACTMKKKNACLHACVSYVEAPVGFRYDPHGILMPSYEMFRSVQLSMGPANTSCRCP